MGFEKVSEPVVGFVSSGLGAFGRMKYVLIAVVAIAVIGSVVAWIKQSQSKKTQWTHKIRVRRKLLNGEFSKEIIHLCRRFPPQQGVEVFELEKPILGSYLIPQPSEYVEVNTFSIILDENNRIWANKGMVFNKDTQSLEVSAVHAGIDAEMGLLKERWQQAHTINKKITTAELIKAGLKALMIVALTIVGVMAVSAWGDAQLARADQATQEALAMANLAEAISVMDKVVNTQQLQLVPMLKAVYDTDNIAPYVEQYCEVIEEDGED